MGKLRGLFNFYRLIFNFVKSNPANEAIDRVRPAGPFGLG